MIRDGQIVELRTTQGPRLFRTIAQPVPRPQRDVWVIPVQPLTRLESFAWRVGHLAGILKSLTRWL